MRFQLHSKALSLPVCEAAFGSIPQALGSEESSWLDPPYS